jgi:hypothetical protein
MSTKTPKKTKLSHAEKLAHQVIKKLKWDDTSGNEEVCIGGSYWMIRNLLNGRPGYRVTAAPNGINSADGDVLILANTPLSAALVKERVLITAYGWGGLHDVITENDINHLYLCDPDASSGWTATIPSEVRMNDVTLYPSGKMRIGCQVRTLAEWREQADSIISTYGSLLHDSRKLQKDVLLAFVPLAEQFLKTHTPPKNAHVFDNDDALKRVLLAKLGIKPKKPVKKTTKKTTKKTAAKKTTRKTAKRK